MPTVAWLAVAALVASTELDAIPAKSSRRSADAAGSTYPWLRASDDGGGGLVTAPLCMKVENVSFEIPCCGAMITCAGCAVTAN
eukprot:CAMPEP_0115456996 /NCGR_PEP_ID=MMETSP0271-20121206/44976_1 /TAXON_ID=71861 /ORGANISM="Scrippsiella trochoidea, Strain CCMP3099" /LENGTH=83 /DNA_ID=CAMNT_0002883529 /DNA_START=949 /DNA_END=1200 /DNA_ORIENTATION=-